MTAASRPARPSILTPTSGFLAPGFTHTINAYRGCAFAGSFCGLYCYAQHNQWIPRGERGAFTAPSRPSLKPTAAIMIASNIPNVVSQSQSQST